MKRLFTILFALFVSFYSSAQCTDPSASNYNFHGLFDTYNNFNNDIGLPNQCCYQTTMLISSLQDVYVEINDYGYLTDINLQALCLGNGLYVIEVYFSETEPSQVAIQLSDGQTFSLDSSLGSPYTFEISIGEYVQGCMDPSACNFNPDATAPQILCDYSCRGCTDQNALNYDPMFTIDDGSCLYQNALLRANGPYICYSSFYQDGVSAIMDPSSGLYSVDLIGTDECNWLLFDLEDPSLEYNFQLLKTDGELIVQRSFQGSDVFGNLAYDSEGIIEGCDDPQACNYDPNAYCTNFYSCTYGCDGCTDPLATNYDPNALVNDYSCCIGEILTFDYPSGFGPYTNFMRFSNGDWISSSNGSIPEMFCFDGGCFFIYENYLTEPVTFFAYRNDGTLMFQASSSLDDLGYHSIEYMYCENDIWGCRDQFACNYNPSANVDGECDYSCHGCTDPTAPNYNPAATIENNTCCYDSWLTLEFSEPCFWYIYNPFTGMYLEGNYPEDNGYCSDQVLDPFTWGMSVVNDDHAQISGSRFITDCYILQAISVSGNPVDFTITDGSGQVIASSTGNTDPILNADVSENADDEPGCTDPIACNYNINASCNNGSCIYNCGGCTDVNALNFNSDASWEDGSCQYTLQAPNVTYTTSPAILPNHFMIEFNIQELGNSFEYILSSDYNTAQRIVDEYTTYEMGPYPCDVAIDFKMRSLDFNLVEAWSAEDVQVACTSLSVEETATERTFGFYPNPANDRIVLTGLGNEQYTLQVIDIAGRVALNQTIIGNAAGVEVTLNNLQSGAYIVRVFNDSGSQSARLILEGR
jgi:hypothetical protein